MFIISSKMNDFLCLDLRTSQIMVNRKIPHNSPSWVGELEGGSPFSRACRIKGVGGFLFPISSPFKGEEESEDVKEA